MSKGWLAHCSMTYLRVMDARQRSVKSLAAVLICGLKLQVPLIHTVELSLEWALAGK